LFPGFNVLDGETGGDRFFAMLAAWCDAPCGGAATLPSGVDGPRLFVRRYRVPHALHSIGFDAGPRRHCGESVEEEGKGGGRQRVFS
jgi:hypothetical protein